MTTKPLSDDDDGQQTGQYSMVGAEMVERLRVPSAVVQTFAVAATPGAYRWIDEAVTALKEAKAHYVSFGALYDRINDLLSGVPCQPEDLGFDSPGDRYARAWHALNSTPPSARVEWAEVAIAMLSALREDYAPGDLKDTDGVKAIKTLQRYARRYRTIRSKLCNGESLEFNRLPSVGNLAGLARITPSEIDAAVDAMRTVGPTATEKP